MWRISNVDDPKIFPLLADFQRNLSLHLAQVGQHQAGLMPRGVGVEQHAQHILIGLLGRYITAVVAKPFQD